MKLFTAVKEFLSWPIIANATVMNCMILLGAVGLGIKKDSLIPVGLNPEDRFQLLFGLIATLILPFISIFLAKRPRWLLINLLIVAGFGLAFFTLAILDMTGQSGLFSSLLNATDTTVGAMIGGFLLGVTIFLLSILISHFSKHPFFIWSFYLFILVNAYSGNYEFYYPLSSYELKKPTENWLPLTVITLLSLLSYLPLFWITYQKTARQSLPSIVKRLTLLKAILAAGAIVLVLVLIQYYQYVFTQLKKIDDLSSEREKNRLNYSDKNQHLPLVISGFYTARQPVYLKTNIFMLEADSVGLRMWPKQFSPTDVISSGTDSISVAPRQLTKVATESVKVVYRHRTGETLPTAEQITHFSTSDPDLSYLTRDGIFYSGPTTTNSKSPPNPGPAVTTRFEYDFTHYLRLSTDDTQPSQVKNFTNPRAFYASQNYVSIYPDSERYPEIKALAKQITSESKTDYDKAAATEAYFHNNYQYTLTPHIADQKNPIDDFIFDTKKGYCAYFATAMSMMLETLYIPNRVVVGYYSTHYSESVDAYVMLSTDLHAWVEVFVPNYGWVTFDPTTGNCADDAAGCSLTNLHLIPESSIESLLQEIQPGMSFEDLYQTDIFISSPLLESKNFQEFETEIHEPIIKENPLTTVKNKLKAFLNQVKTYAGWLWLIGSVIIAGIIWRSHRKWAEWSRRYRNFMRHSLVLIMDWLVETRLKKLFGPKIANRAITNHKRHQKLTQLGVENDYLILLSQWWQYREELLYHPHPQVNYSQVAEIVRKILTYK